MMITGLFTNGVPHAHACVLCWTAWTDCGAGQSVETAGTVSVNRKCTACTAGEDIALQLLALLFF